MTSATSLKVSRRATEATYPTLTAMGAHAQHIRRNSKQTVVSSRQIEAIPVGRDNVQVRGPQGAVADLTNWAFNQLCQRSGGPAGYLGDLPAPLAADCINYGLRFIREAEDVGILAERTGTSGGVTLRAVTGPNYGRIWTSDMLDVVIEAIGGDGVSGDWINPFLIGQDNGANFTPAYLNRHSSFTMSDRDARVFLSDAGRPLTVRNRRGGAGGEAFLGFTIGNSEVGSATLEANFFLFDRVCQNRTVFGVRNKQSLRIRHTAKAPDRYREELIPQLKAFIAAEVEPFQAMVTAAQQRKLDDVDAFLATRFSASQAATIADQHFVEEGRPIETLWDASVGITAFARKIAFQDERVLVERIGGDVLQLAA